MNEGWVVFALVLPRAQAHGQTSWAEVPQDWVAYLHTENSAVKSQKVSPGRV